MHRSTKITQIKACDRFAPVDPSIIGTSTAGTEYTRPGGACPVHESTACVETFVAETELATFTVWEFLAARRIWRQRAERRRVAEALETHRG